MKERKHAGMFRPWLLLVSLLLTIGLLLPNNLIGADNSISGSAPGESIKWSTVTVTTAKVDLTTIGRPSKDNPKLGSSLNQLLGANRLRGLAGARAFAVSHNMVLQDDRVQVAIMTTEEAIGDVRDAVGAMGGQYQLHYRNLLQALVPIGELAVLAQRPDIRVIREPRRAIPQPTLPPSPMVGNQTTEGVAASNASAWHTLGYDGTGVRVAVIDGGFTNYTTLLGTDLPGSVAAYDWTGTGMGGSVHGTACAEVVYDMAYGAAMDLHKISTSIELGTAVGQAIDDGVDIISMSLGWILDGPGDGTGFLADIVNNARSNGILYAAAAGNNAEYCWSGTYNDFGNDTHQWVSGENVNYFGPSPGYVYNLPAGFPIIVGLHWDDWTVVDQDYDMYLVWWDGDSWEAVAWSENDQAGGYPTPEEYIGVYAPYGGWYGVVVSRRSATRDVCLRLLGSHSYGLTLALRVPERSVVFPGDSPDAITVAAVDVDPPYLLEPYSSRGPIFGPGGVCSGGSIKPDIAAYANVSTVSYGAGVFAGTSAATPHVAGAAAILKEAYPDYTVDDLQDDLEANAIDLGNPGKDNLYGSGRLYLGNPPEGEPQLNVDPVTLDFGSTNTEETFNITNTGEDHSILNWTASPVEAWITVDPTEGTTTAGAEPSQVTVTVDRTQIPEYPTPGEYTGTVTVDSDGGTQDVTILATIAAVPVLRVNPTSLEFKSFEPDATEKSFDITNQGTGVLTWNITPNQPWIAVNPPGGTTTTETDTITVTVDRSGLDPGKYAGVASVTSDGGNQDVSITMEVGISISGKVLDLSHLPNEIGIEGIGVSIATPPDYTSIEDTSDGNGDYELESVPPNTEDVSILCEGGVGFVNTYTAFFTTGAQDIEENVYITPQEFYDSIVDGFGVTQQAGKGVIAGAVLDLNLQGKAGAKVSTTPSYDDVFYFAEDGTPDPTLEETSSSGWFVIFNVDPAAGDVEVTATMSPAFATTKARAYANSVTIAPVAEFVEEIPPPPPGGGGGGGGGGCFVATAAYGSRMAEDVRVLEKVRDEYLLTNELGRVFVSAYYKYSPLLADWIAKHPAIRKAVRISLYPIIGLSKRFVREKPSR